MSEIIRNRRGLEDRLRDLTLATAERLGVLAWLEINVAFDDRGTDDDGSAISLATELGDWQYRRATIRWGLRAAASAPDDELLAAAIHEIIHALMEPLWGCIPTKQQTDLALVNELSTENLTRAIIAALS